MVYRGPRTWTLVVSQDPLYGQGMKRLLETTGRGGPVLYFDSLERAAGTIPPERDAGECYVVLWIADSLDEASADDSGYFRQRHPDVGLCVLAHGLDIRHARQLLSEQAGWVSVLERTRNPSLAELIDVLEMTARGRARTDSRLLERLAAGSNGGLPSTLTAMEERVLELIADGLRNREIARRTCLSEKAVEKHISRLFAKLGLDSQKDPAIDRRVTAAKLFIAERRLAGIR